MALLRADGLQPEQTIDQLFDTHINFRCQGGAKAGRSAFVPLTQLDVRFSRKKPVSFVTTSGTYSSLS